ncbi:hypothetical protein BN938_0580 [Mucinivorans hirudinis]|uniref:Mobile element protein n=1 Tax=Mucinivorans hirudinis TaxID=1433126 RepID=A0A060R6D1_9BACT|nr:hypothetical protein BN938_0491 [Mucinivorans hirudinis]CDN30685.1 hypothetical protein BN938_0580 [Mucinivorans hirudinis]
MIDNLIYTLNNWGVILSEAKNLHRNKTLTFKSINRFFASLRMTN